MNKDIWGILCVLSTYIFVLMPIGVASPDSCGDEGCHEKEYLQLTDSMHSKSWNEPLFQSFYQRAVDSMREEKAAEDAPGFGSIISIIGLLVAVFLIESQRRVSKR